LFWRIHINITPYFDNMETLPDPTPATEVIIDKTRVIKIKKKDIRPKTNITTPVQDNLQICNSDCIEKIKQIGMNWVDKVLESELTYTKPGSISHLLYGEKPSEQSINIKLGRLGEFLSKELIKTNDHLELLHCGIQNINDRKKDVDLIFKDEANKTIYYRELKGNIELDTEKLPATITKCKEIETSLKSTYIDYIIDCGILNWSVYNRKILSAGLSNIKTFENGGIKIDHMADFLQIVDIFWNEYDYYSYFREIGTKIKIRFE